MAGDKPHVLFDPSIDRWAAMRENVYQHFKFTRPATNKVIAWGVVFPLSVYAVASLYDNKFDWSGKRRGESLLAVPPKAEAAAEE